MIYKVFYQANPSQVPVRENTQSLYIEAENERDARKKLADRIITIEYIKLIAGVFLDYEMKKPGFEVVKG